MNAMSLMATLGIDTSEYDKGLKGASGTASNFASTFKKVLGGIAIGTAVTKVGQAVVSLTKSAVSAYADYQQLEGGVETLFGNGGKSFEQYAESASDSLYKMGQRGEDVLKMQKELVEAGYDIGSSGADGIYGPKTKAAFDAYAKAGGQMVRDAYDKTGEAADQVIENAKKAYMTAGLDANTYMETVTGFSASLLQSLGGDTMKAAELSDQAMIDMADNSNKMGTDIGAIMVAYQGFAKQNYTMLDNLKLGYGGTKTEMERLIKDANKLRVAQGLAGDLTIEKYSDVIEAIHMVQTEMGITGTTALEAQTTITGSLNATKAAWKNLLISFATGNKRDIKQAMDGMVASARNVVTNVVPVVSTALTSISGFIGEIAPVVAQELPGIITEVGPAFLNAVSSLAGSLISNFPAMISGLGSAVAEAITGDPNADFGAVAGAIIDGINAKAGELAGAIKLAITGDENADWGEVGSAIIDDIQNALQGGANIIKEALGIDENFTFDEIGTAISTAISDAKTAIEDIDWSEVGTNVANKVSSALNLVISGMKGIFTTAKNAIYDINWSDVGTTIWNLIKGAFVTIGGLFEGIFGQGVDGALRVDWAGLGSSILDLIVTALSGIGETIFSFFESAWNDISNDPTLIALGDSIKQPFTDAIDALKADWESIGDFFSGIWEGITSDETLTGLVDSMKKPFTDAVDGLKENWESIGEFFSGIWEGITTNETFVGLVDAIKKPFTDAVDGLKENWESIGEFFSGIWDGISTNETLIGLVDTIKKPFEDAKKAIDDVIKSISEGISSMISKVSEWTGIDLTAPFSGIAEAAQAAFNSVVSAIQGAIDKAKEFLGLKPNYDTSVVGEYGPQLSTKGHATAMAHGEILRGLTPFGVDSFGTIHYGGEAGPEAIVGVNSLDGMIQQSVNNAVGAVLSRLDTIIGGQNQGDIQVVLDSGVLVGQMARGMDRQMGKLATWRGGGRV